MAIGGIGRQVARSAEDIAALLRTARRRLTTPEWSGPGIEFTRPLPRNRSGVPLEPLPETAAVRAPVYEGRGIPEVPDGPRTVQFPQLDVNEAGEDITRYVAEDIVPIRPEFLDFFDESVSIDPVRAQFELANFIENLTTPNELYRASVLMQRIRPSANRNIMKGLERSLEEAALRLGIPPTQRMGPMYLFQYVSPEGTPPVAERTFTNLIGLRDDLRKAAGGKKEVAAKGGFVRLSNLEKWDSGAGGGIIGNARAEGIIDEVGEAQLRQQLEYWRGVIYEGMGVEPSSLRGLGGLKISESMSEQERFMRIAQAMRTADSLDELAAIKVEAEDFIPSSSYMDMVEDIFDQQIRRVGMQSIEPGESAAVMQRRVYGQSDDLERGGLETFTPEEEFVVRSLPRGAGDAPPAIEGSLKDIAARVNTRLRRLGVEPLDRRAVRAIPLETSARGVNIEPSELTGGGSLPISVENWEMYRQIQARKGIKVPRNPEGYYRSGGWIFPKQSGMGSAVAPQRGRSVELSQRETDKAVLNMLIEEGAVGRTGGAVRAVPDEVIESGTDVQRAWARRYGQSRVDQLMSSDAQTRREAALATRAARDEGLLSDEMLAELREAAGITRRAPATQPAAPNVPRETGPATASVKGRTWARYPEGAPNYEVSTQGDRRFSAFNARLRGRGGKSIEDVYQIDIKGGEKIAPGRYTKKGSLYDGPLTEDELYAEYKKLWAEFFEENPQLLDEIARRAAGRRLTDQFASSDVSQARAIDEILVERGMRYRVAPAAQPAAPTVPRETPAVSANAPNVNTPPPAPSVTAGAGNIVPVNPNNSGMISYIPRTIENAQSSDITIAVATDFTTSGEKLTKNAALGRVRAELRDEPSRYNPEQTIKIWRRVDGTRNGEFGEVRPIVQIRHGAENLDEYVDQIVETLNGIAAQTGRPVTINGAGNGIARLRSQAEADVYARHIMARIVNHPNRNFEIGLVRSGGQNGYDVAFNKAAKVYGIRTEINPAYSSNGMVNVQTKSGESERISVAQYVRRYQLGTGDIGEIS